MNVIESLLKEVEAFFRGVPDEEGGLLLAVSGGVDSTVMADVIHRLFPEKRVGIAHVNFHLREEDSNRDQEFVRNLAQRYGFEFYTTDFDTSTHASEHGVSIEIAARELRYGWFCSLAAEEGFKLLCTAHNANDNAETLLLNLVRGTGRQGLGGIRPKGLVNGSDLMVIRPFLNVERSEIEEYARENNLSWCTDRTNSQNEYSRNKVRNQVIPLLEQINPSVIRSLCRDISRFQDLNSEVDKLVGGKVDSLLLKNGPDKGNIIDLLRKKYLVFRSSVERIRQTGNVRFYLAELLRRFSVPLNEDELDRISDGLDSDNPSTRVYFLKEGTATIERGELRLYSSLGEVPSAFEIEGCGQYVFGSMKISVSLEEASSAGPEAVNFSEDGNCISVMDASDLDFPLVCRTLKEGDSFSPFGLKGSKKVADFLNSRKADLLFKNIVPVVTKKDGRIVCLPSLEIDNRYKVTSLSKKLLMISVSSS